ncbi:unnamed protein product [Closterium sp. NIES-64]|nr:unnamed protein product [Closterium sp. NIES-64]
MDPTTIVEAANPRVPRGSVVDEKQKVLRTVQDILNKLTPETFDPLFQQLLTAGINTPEILQGVINLIFTKAVDEPTFCPMYAALCEKLSRALPEFPPSNGAGRGEGGAGEGGAEEGGAGEGGAGAGGNEPISFRSVLLNTCQEEFERAVKLRIQVITSGSVREGGGNYLISPSPSPLPLGLASWRPCWKEAQQGTREESKEGQGFQYLSSSEPAALSLSSSFCPVAGWRAAGIIAGRKHERRRGRRGGGGRGEGRGGGGGGGGGRGEGRGGGGGEEEGGKVEEREREVGGGEEGGEERGEEEGGEVDGREREGGEGGGVEERGEGEGEGKGAKKRGRIRGGRKRKGKGENCTKEVQGSLHVERGEGGEDEGTGEGDEEGGIEGEKGPNEDDDREKREGEQEREKGREEEKGTSELFLQRMIHKQVSDCMSAGEWFGS